MSFYEKRPRSHPPMRRPFRIPLLLIAGGA